MGGCLSKRNDQIKHLASNISSNPENQGSKISKASLNQSDIYYAPGESKEQNNNSSIIRQRNTILLSVVEQEDCQKESYSVCNKDNFKLSDIQLAPVVKNSNQTPPFFDLPIVQEVNVNNPENLNNGTMIKSSMMELDEKSIYGIKNLPQKWISEIRKSAISPQQIRTNPKALIDVITAFEMNYQQSLFPQKLISSMEFTKHIEGVQLINENPYKNWNFKQLLGKGYDCEVYRIQSKIDKKNYAVRIFRLKQNTQLQKIKRQIAAIKLCSSKNVIDYEFSYLYNDKVYMFINYMNGGSITHFLKQQRSKLSQQIIAYLLREILIGLRAIHKMRQIHRDIKSDNILLNEFGEIKITDFGHAIQLTSSNKSPKQAVGTPAWMAPQLIKREVYNESVDVWSLGILALELALGQPPYLRMNQLKAMYEILSKPPPKLPDQYSLEFKKFVNSCLQKNPQDRCNVVELLQSPFIKSINQGIKQKIKLKEIIKKYCNKN